MGLELVLNQTVSTEDLSAKFSMEKNGVEQYVIVKTAKSY